MILTPHAVEMVATRIERAYWRRHRQENSWSGPDPRLWDLAARALMAAHRAEPWLPLDPELFVMSQPRRTLLDDPWQELAASEAIERYRRRVLRIARGLRRELRVEVRRVERRLRLGLDLEALLRDRPRGLSPLGAYLVAHRAGRLDLVSGLQDGVLHQHASCPLYRVACRRVLPGSAYPVIDLLPGLTPTPRRGPAPRGDGLN